MKIAVEDMTPRKAARILQAAEGFPQRSLSLHRVARYANSMQRGQWQLTHQGIALDANGILIDGQHRLRAVVESGETVQMLVTRGADPAMFDVLDIGATRTAGNTLQIAGYTNTNIVASAARIVLTYDAVKDTIESWSGVGRTFTPTDILEFVNSPRGQHMLAHATLTEHVANRFGRPGARTWLLAAHLLVSEAKLPPEVVKQFWEDVAEGANLPSGSPILTLRRWMALDNNADKRNLRSIIALSVLIKALNKYVAGESATVLSFKVGIERYPVIQGLKA